MSIRDASRSSFSRAPGPPARAAISGDRMPKGRCRTMRMWDTINTPRAERRMNRSRRQFLWTVGAVAIAGYARASPLVEDDAYRFSGSISQTVLANYLSRSIAMPGLWSHHAVAVGDASQYSAGLRMLEQLGPKHVPFACDASWESSVAPDADTVLAAGKIVTRDLHEIDREIIVGGACYETAGAAADTVRIPGWVFDEMHLPYEDRTFRWERMVYSNDQTRDGHTNAPAIDITQLESRMWYYFWSRSYIDLGVEHMHFGELESLSRNDGPGFLHYRNLLARVQDYAARRARRGLVLISTQERAENEWTRAELESSRRDEGQQMIDRCDCAMSDTFRTNGRGTA
jgi:hypothetical protein